MTDKLNEIKRFIMWLDQDDDWTERLGNLSDPPDPLESARGHIRYLIERVEELEYGRTVWVRDRNEKRIVFNKLQEENEKLRKIIQDTISKIDSANYDIQEIKEFLEEQLEGGL